MCVSVPNFIKICQIDTELSEFVSIFKMLAVRYLTLLKFRIFNDLKG